MFFVLKCCIVLNNIFLFYITIVQSVPQDYCFGVLNRSDCGLPPTPVFSYSKPGSRCEIETWRGCPSENLFKDEYQCSDRCIGKLFRPSGEGQSSVPPKKLTTVAGSGEVTMEEDIVVTSKPCLETLNTAKCTGEESQVFTFENDTRTCVEATYHGCETLNKFDDREQCETACLNKKDKWANTINQLHENELENIDAMVDKAVDNRADDVIVEDAAGKGVHDAMVDKPAGKEIDKIAGNESDDATIDKTADEKVDNVMINKTAGKEIDDAMVDKPEGEESDNAMVDKPAGKEADDQLKLIKKDSAKMESEEEKSASVEEGVIVRQAKERLVN